MFSFGVKTSVWAQLWKTRTSEPKYMLLSQSDKKIYIFFHTYWIKEKHFLILGCKSKVLNIVLNITAVESEKVKACKGNFMAKCACNKRKLKYPKSSNEPKVVELLI